MRNFAKKLLLALFISLLTSEHSSAFEIISREDWGAEETIEKRVPAIKTGKFGNRIVRAENTAPLRTGKKYITIHHVGRSPSRHPFKKTMKDFQKQMQDGYFINLAGGRRLYIYPADIPYHYFILNSGEVAVGRPMKYAAYSNTKYNTPISEHITVVLDGDFKSKAPNKKQLQALEDTLSYLSKKHKISNGRISWHKEVAKSDCPGSKLIDLLPSIIGRVEN